MRLADRITRPHLPRRTVRLRLTLVYGAMFLACGIALLAVTYLLVAHATDTGVYRNGNTIFVVGHQGSGPTPSTSTPSTQTNTDGTGSPSVPQISPALAKKLANQQHADLLHQLLLQSDIALAITTVVSIGLGWLVAGRVLRPLRTITAAVRGISETNLHQRLALTGPDDELTELGDTFDGLLARLDASFHAQRSFIANASHELRTPLARQRTIGQVALADPDACTESLRAAHERVLAAGAQQERIIESLLTLARGQAGLHRHDRVDLAGLTEQILAARGAEAAARDIDLRTTLRPAPTGGDPRLVERLIANLVDNGLRHNHPNGHLDVRTETRDGHAVLTVTNTGPGIPADAIERLFQPFRRLDPDRTGDGLGLGLAIVQAIADAHDATIAAQPCSHGGLTIEISFPIPTQPPDDPNTTPKPDSDVTSTPRQPSTATRA
jgi:signal transduction histidine kinase